MKLKPCPFCGGVARTRTHRTNLFGDLIDVPQVGCKRCAIWFTFPTAAEARAWWNKRAKGKDER